MPSNARKHRDLRRPERPSSPRERRPPCLVCGKDHKCSVGKDGLILCGRRAGNVPGFLYRGQAQGDPQYGVYRRESDGSDGSALAASAGLKPKPTVGLGQEESAPQETADRRACRATAAALGIPPRAFKRLGTGWDEKGACSDVPREKCGGDADRDFPPIPFRQEATNRWRFAGL